MICKLELCRNDDDDDDDDVLAPPWNLVNAAASGIIYQRLKILWGCWFCSFWI
jgi:hypothetical protein